MFFVNVIKSGYRRQVNAYEKEILLYKRIKLISVLTGFSFISVCSRVNLECECGVLLQVMDVEVVCLTLSDEFLSFTLSR